MLIPLKRQCLGLLSLWQCFPLLGILWRKILLLLQTKSPAVWTIGRAFVFRSGSRYDKVFSNISHSNIIKERIHWYSLKKLAAHLYSGVGHTLLGLAKWLYLVCNWMVPWSLEVVHLLSLCLWKGISCSRRVLVKLLLPISPKSSFHFLEENILENDIGSTAIVNANCENHKDWIYKRWKQHFLQLFMHWDSDCSSGKITKYKYRSFYFYFSQIPWALIFIPLIGLCFEVYCCVCDIISCDSPPLHTKQQVREAMISLLALTLTLRQTGPAPLVAVITGYRSYRGGWKGYRSRHRREIVISSQGWRVHRLCFSSQWQRKVLWRK